MVKKNTSDIALVLVDFDDTLVDTGPRFQRARRALIARLVGAGFSRESAHRTHHAEVDPEMRERYGLGPKRMPHSFRETYRRLCGEGGTEHDPALADELEALGRAVKGPPPCLDGAMAALGELAAAHDTVVYTQSGDPEYQMGCVRAAGVLDIVPEDRVHVHASKTADELRATLRHYGVRDAATAWMIGNSIRSDVNPALAAGARAIHVELEDAWHVDQVPPLSDDFVRVGSFAEAVRYLLDGAGGATLRGPGA